MTDRLAGLRSVVSNPQIAEKDKQELLGVFYDQAKGDNLVINKWFSLQVLFMSRLGPGYAL